MRAFQYIKETKSPIVYILIFALLVLMFTYNLNCKGKIQLQKQIYDGNQTELHKQMHDEQKTELHKQMHDAQTTELLKQMQYKLKTELPLQMHDEPKAEFRAILEANGIYTFSNVCVEELKTAKLENRSRLLFNETKKIVVYGDNGYSDGTSVTLNVAGSENSQWNHWEIQFRQQTLPVDHVTSFRDTAFFVATTCPGNFHHFFVDTFIPLYNVVALSNRLYPGFRNQILYRTPQVVSSDRCFSRHRYEGFLRTLYTDEFHEVFYNLPNNTCFRHAVFGNTPLRTRQRDVIDHVLRYYNLTLRNSRNAGDMYVTILQRKERRIINADELRSFAIEVGFKNVRIVEFESESIQYQLEVMSTTNVFIGIQGAGLQWSVFMPEGSYLIELAWPQKHWRFYFEIFVLNYGIKWRGVGVQDVRLNWTSYEINVRHGVPVSEAEKPSLIRNHPRDEADNIWKWSDIVVQKHETLGTLQTAYNELQAIKIV